MCSFLIYWQIIKTVEAVMVTVLFWQRLINDFSLATLFLDLSRHVKMI